MMSRAERTRATLLDAALAAFAQRGVRATTLEHVAASAALTRGAIYWHFPDKESLVKAVFEDMVWPFDIGASPDAAPPTEDPLGLLHEVLWQKMHDSLMNPRQRRRTEIAVRYRGTPELPEELSAHLQQLLLRGLERLIVMLNLAYERGELRRGLNPVGVAQSLVAACIGVVVEHMNNPQADLIHSFSFAPGLVLLGAGRHLNPR